MPPVANKRSMMILYSAENNYYCHQVRIVLAEKDVTYEAIDASLPEYAQELPELNPYGELPVLVDRELVLFEPRIIMEYLDERFPHPPLLPVYPVARAQYRLMLHRVEKDWFSLVRKLEQPEHPEKETARKVLQDSIIALAPIFDEQPYFMSETFSLIDCALAPLFWRLPHFGVEIPKQAKQLLAYQDSLFTRDSFKQSLTEAEKELR